ncbi:MAG: enoyl-[acyl-carrier-protein] reductase [Polyangiaceae bacterium]
MLSIDLTGRRAFVAGVADDGGFGFAIAKAFIEAGATVCVGTWPPAMNIFLTLLKRGKIDEGAQALERLAPRIRAHHVALDAAFDTLEDAPAELRESNRYKDKATLPIAGAAALLKSELGEQPFDIFVHALANGSEVKKPLLETSRKGYLEALSVSAYSMVSMARAFAPLMKKGGSMMSLTYMASERVIPGYGGGMSSAKAALESDTRTLAFEVGRRYGLRVNTISAGPYASRAASAIGIIENMIEYCSANSPLTDALTAEEVANTAAFLASPLASGITGATLYVDKGYHAMGKAVHDRYTPPSA